MRIGVVVVVRAPGRVVHRVAVRGLRVRRVRGMRILEVRVVNGGNVTETIDSRRIGLSVRQRSAQLRLRADGRDLRPRTLGLVQFRYSGRLVGWVTARVRLAPIPGQQVVVRTFRVKL